MPLITEEVAGQLKEEFARLVNPVRLAVIANHHFDDVRLPTIPQWLQKAGLVLGAPTGRLLGYRPTFDPTPGELAPAAA